MPITVRNQNRGNQQLGREVGGHIGLNCFQSRTKTSRTRADKQQVIYIFLNIQNAGFNKPFSVVLHLFFHSYITM
jgi:hypothetical protein